LGAEVGQIDLIGVADLPSIRKAGQDRQLSNFDGFGGQLAHAAFFFEAQATGQGAAFGPAIPFVIGLIC